MSDSSLQNIALSRLPLPCVLIVEPNTALASERIAPLFEPYARTVQATTLDEVRAFCRQSPKLTLALVELDLPGTPSPGAWQDHVGFEAVEHLVKSYPKAKVCIFSRDIPVEYINRAHGLGASYISKLGGYNNLKHLARSLAP